MTRISEQDAAYCAAAWASGTTQKELARQFGYKKAPPVCVAIERFVSKYGSSASPGYRVEYGTIPEFGVARKALVPEAIKVYQRILQLREQERSAPVFPQSVEQIRDKMREEVRHATYWSYPEPVTQPPPPAFAFGRVIERVARRTSGTPLLNTSRWARAPSTALQSTWIRARSRLGCRSPLTFGLVARLYIARRERRPNPWRGSNDIRRNAGEGG